MYFPYGIWRAAEQEAKRLPPSNNNGCGIIVAILVGGIFAFECFKIGGIGVLLGIAVILGVIQGLNK